MRRRLILTESLHDGVVDGSLLFRGRVCHGFVGWISMVMVYTPSSSKGGVAQCDTLVVEGRCIN